MNGTGTTGRAAGRAANRTGRSETRGAARAAYVHGTAAAKPEAERRSAERRNPRGFRVLNGGRTAKKPSKKSTAANLLFMVGALVVATLVLYRYVDVQTSLEGSATTISQLEKELASLKQENDEAYSRANATVDLEEVKRVAIQELGMKYADEGQIVVYSDDGAADYVRQLAEIPEAAEK